MSRLRLHLLGGFGLVGGAGQGVALPTRKAQALLARVGRRPGEEVSREHLVGLLWPDVPDEQGRVSLRQALSGARRALGEARPVLRAGEGGVSLDPELAEVDVAELERALLAGGAEADALLARSAEPFLAGFPPMTDLFDAEDREWLVEGLSRVGLAAAAASS